MTYQQVGLNSVDAEFLASRAFSVGEICRLFMVPEPLLLTGQRLQTDMSQFTAQFAVQCLSPLVATIEAEFANAVLPPGIALRLDMGGLMRGSYSASVAALAALKQSGIISANDARSELGWPAVTDGDGLMGSAAPNWPADAKGMPALHPSPGATGSGLPDPGTHGNEGAA